MEKISIYIPKRMTVIYTIAAIILIPWIFDLAQNLPSKHVARHWDTQWVGFDVFIFIATAFTVYFMVKRTVWLVVSASALATLLLVDAWFDILTAKPGKEIREAIFFGVIEVGLSLLTYRLVFRVVHSSTPQKNLKLKTTK